MSAWTDHVEKWKDCTKCPLCRQRDRICLARGRVPCDVLFIGEAPGDSEDVAGLPFVETAPAGRLLQQIINRAIPDGVTYALTNLVCCFPREAKEEGTHQPHMSEIKECRPRLVEFINITQPKLIVCVGALATEYVDHHNTVRCIDILHPAYILKRLPLVQKRMAVDKICVVIRNAVEFMQASGHIEFTKWGERHASSQTLRQELSRAIDDAGHTEADIPF